jgi:hypothetical protein
MGSLLLAASSSVFLASADHVYQVQVPLKGVAEDPAGGAVCSNGPVNGPHPIQATLRLTCCMSCVVDQTAQDPCHVCCCAC